jgi:hypothetical protein
MKDLIQISDDLAVKADAAGNIHAEKVLSRIQAELKDDFKDDLVDDYLKRAQLLDPRVCNRTRPYTPAEIDRLLQLLLIYLPATDGGGVSDEDDAPCESYTAEFSSFKTHMKKTKVKIPSIPNAQGAEATEVQYKYYGGVDRREDIDIFKFYQDLLPQIPNIAMAIRTILAHQPCTIDNERIFNISGHVISLQRCSLTPERAEQLILSAFRYRCRSRSKKPPRLPSFAILIAKTQ